MELNERKFKQTILRSVKGLIIEKSHFCMSDFITFERLESVIKREFDGRNIIVSKQFNDDFDVWGLRFTFYGYGEYQALRITSIYIRSLYKLCDKGIC